MSSGAVVTVPAPWSGLADRYRELASSGPDLLRRLRREAWERFTARGLPGRREEDWREIDVEPLGELPLVPAAPRAGAVSPAILDHPAVARPAPPRLVLAGGRLREDLSAAAPLPAGIEVRPLAEAAGGPGRDEVEAHLGRLAPEGDPFASLNQALFEEGLLVRVAPGVDVDVPLHLVHVAPAAGTPVACHPRILVVAGGGARITLVESFLGIEDAEGLVNAVTEIVLAPDARVVHARVQHESGRVRHVARVAAEVSRGASWQSLSIALGGPLVRVDVDARLAGEGAECSLDGLYLAGSGEVVDHRTTIRHEVPRCASSQLYKGVLSGDGRGIFRGRIVVAPGAQQTDARQQNRNLLLSREAVARTRPQLEIYADDVRATHGATVGQLDDEMLFYFRSRGIGLAEARHLLLAAFTGEILERVPGNALADLLEEITRRRLARELAREEAR